MTEKKRAVILGAGGFIGSHLVKRLKNEGYFVRGIDLKFPEFDQSLADEFFIADIRKIELVYGVIDTSIDEVYQLAADMGGAGYLFSGKYDADIYHNSAMINMNVAQVCNDRGIKKLFFSSSACVYPEYNQESTENPICSEDSVYPAQPESDYGFEKLAAERMYITFKKQYNLNVKIARFHTIYGPLGTFDGGKEKAPAALCRKVAKAKEEDCIEVWGDGKQTRSFLYIDDCIDAVRKLMESNFNGPVNIGSDHLISINDLVQMIIGFSGKNITIKHIEGPEGVRGRNSDNTLIKEKLDWTPVIPTEEGMKKTFEWINKQVNA